MHELTFGDTRLLVPALHTVLEPLPAIDRVALAAALRNIDAAQKQAVVLSLPEGWTWLVTSVYRCCVCVCVCLSVCLCLSVYLPLCACLFTCAVSFAC